MGRQEFVNFSKEIASNFHQGIDDWYAFQQSDLDRTWKILNSFAHALNGETVEYFSGRIHDAVAGDIEIAAYTTRFLIYFRGVPGEHGPSYHVIPRASLTGLQIISAPTMITSHTMGLDPQPAYQVTYADQTNFALPLVAQRRNDDLNAFAPTLWEDLIK
ncbi:hypothetical protein [Glutamicibacter sp. BSL13]